LGGFVPLNSADEAPVGMGGVLFDLLMAVMNSLETWRAAAGDSQRGLLWRDEVTARMAAAGTYSPYEVLVVDAAAHVGLPRAAAAGLVDRWFEMEPWPDAQAIAGLSLPYGFVTNSSAELARIAARRSGLHPRFTLSAEEAGWYKPDVRIYREACRRLGGRRERTVFVAGSPYDAEGARQAGLHAWHVVRRPDHPPSGASISSAPSLTEIVAAIGRDSPAPT
jgi:2-haloalkanoic acid dehalogenase type II